MAEKKVTYKEPGSYFNADMKKAAKQWDKEHAQDNKSAPKRKSK